MVSVMSDYGQFRIPTPDWTKETFGEYREILRRIEALDAKMGQPDCVDPSKAQWMKAIEDRLAALEAAPDCV